MNTLNEDGTIDVMVDGAVQRRRATMRQPSGTIFGRQTHMMSMIPRYEPEVREGEILHTTISGDMHIVTKMGRAQPDG